MAGRPLGDPFDRPANPDGPVWRYTDLAKFLSLLQRRALYFPRVDKLAALDPYEGYYTDAEHLQLDGLTFDSAPKEFRERMALETPEKFETFMQQERYARGDFARQMREMTFVNSWHMQDHESAAMWSLYLKSADGIAIRTTYARLEKAFEPYREFDVMLSPVRYMDYSAESFGFGNVLWPFIHKRKSFEHERELRAIIWTIEHGKNDLQNNKFASTPGLYVDIDIDILIEAVYVAPSAEPWFVDVVAEVLRRFNVDKPVVHSHLARSPVR